MVMGQQCNKGRERQDFMVLLSSDLEFTELIGDIADSEYNP